MVSRQSSGRAGVVPSSSRSARHAARWWAPESISTPSISKITPSTLTARRAPRWWSPEPVQGDEGAEGLEGGRAVLRLGPVRGLRGGDHPPDDELAVPRPRQLVAQMGERVGCQVRERRRRLLVVLVLEPREVLDPPEDGRQSRRAPPPGRGPALLVGMLRAHLEEEAHAVARDGHLEV